MTAGYTYLWEFMVEPAQFEEFQRHNQSFQEVTSYQTFFNSVQYKLRGQGAPLPVRGVFRHWPELAAPLGPKGARA